MSHRDWASAQITRPGSSNALHTGLAVGKDVSVNGRGSISLVPSQRVKDPLQESASRVYKLTVEENAKFLRVVAACAQVTTHYELFLLMHGEIQFFLPQDSLSLLGVISARTTPSST